MIHPPADVRLGCRCLANRNPLENDYSFDFVAPDCFPGHKAVIAFTDGAHGLDDDSHLRTSYATILLNANSPEAVDGSIAFTHQSCVVHCGLSPSAGANYSGEGLGILVALVSIAINVDITIYSDCKSMIDAIRNPPLSETKRFSKGSRAILRTILHVLATRLEHGATTSLVWVAAHTGADDFHSRGNAFADLVAGAVSADDEPPQPFLLNEELATVWRLSDWGSADSVGRNRCLRHVSESFADRGLTHVAGDASTALRSAMSSALLHSWSMDTRSQSLLVREVGTNVIKTLDLARKSRDATLFMFSIMTCTRTLPTADCLLFGADRTTGNMACPLCDSGTQSTWHAFACPALCDVRRETSIIRAGILGRIVETTISAGSMSPVEVGRLRQLPHLLDWHNIARSPLPACPLAAASGNGAADTKLLNTLNWVSLGGVLGMTPPGTFSALRLGAESAGVPEPARRKFSKDVTSLLRDLHLTTLRRALLTYCEWERRAAVALGISSQSLTDDALVVGRLAHYLYGLRTSHD
jgi:hypothetical protein